MKTMTCAQMGGPCETAITAATSDEMMNKGMEHLKAAHPEMVADIEAAPQDSPMMVAWNAKFKKDWDAAPEEN